MCPLYVTKNVNLPLYIRGNFLLFSLFSLSVASGSLLTLSHMINGINVKYKVKFSVCYNASGQWYKKSKRKRKLNQAFQRLLLGPILYDLISPFFKRYLLNLSVDRYLEIDILTMFLAQQQKMRILKIVFCYNEAKIVLSYQHCISIFCQYNFHSSEKEALKLLFVPRKFSAQFQEARSFFFYAIN